MSSRCFGQRSRIETPKESQVSEWEEYLNVITVWANLIRFNMPSSSYNTNPDETASMKLIYYRNLAFVCWTFFRLSHASMSLARLSASKCFTNFSGATTDPIRALTLG